MQKLYQKLFDIKQTGVKLVRDTEWFNYKYATLSQIQEKLWPLLEKHNLLVVHHVDNNQVVTHIINLEDTNETVSSSIPMNEWTKAQDKGSEITYYRRYNLLALLDLETNDDDGEVAQISNTKKEKAWFSDENLKNLQRIKQEWWKLPNLEAVKKKYRVARRYDDELKELLDNQ